MTAVQPWDHAVADAAEEPGTSWQQVVAEEVDALWADLGDAYSAALNGMWSMQCDGLVTRIVRLTRLGHVTPGGGTTFALLLNGIYAGILTTAGIAFDPPDMDEMAALAAANGYTKCPECSLWDGHHTRPCSLRRRTPYERDQERLAAIMGAAEAP
jgi:hypothetical protein